MNLYSLRGVRKTLSGRTVLNNLDMDIPEGRITSLVGPSGSGKSTLLRILNRLLDPDSGQVQYRGRPIMDVEPVSLRRQAVLVPQDSTMFPGTVEDNIRYAPRIHNIADFQPLAALNNAGLSADYLERDAERLSGGERKRVALARALALSPTALLLDEPTSGVDPRSSETIEKSVMGLRDGGTTVIWVTHDMDQAIRVSDFIVNIKNGEAKMPEDSEFLWRDAY